MEETQNNVTQQLCYLIVNIPDVSCVGRLNESNVFIPLFFFLLIDIVMSTQWHNFVFVAIAILRYYRVISFNFIATLAISHSSVFWMMFKRHFPAWKYHHRENKMILIRIPTEWFWRQRGVRHWELRPFFSSLTIIA